MRRTLIDHARRFLAQAGPCTINNKETTGTTQFREPQSLLITVIFPHTTLFYFGPSYLQHGSICTFDLKIYLVALFVMVSSLLVIGH